MRYVIEPMLFAFDQDLSQQELIDYLDELMSLEGWWNQHREDMFIQDSTSDVLYDHNYYPTGNTLKPLLEKHRVDFIQYGDVEKIIVKMLNKSKMIESLYDEPFWEMKSQTLKQPIARQDGVKRPEALHNAFLGLLWHLFMACETGDYDARSFVVITKGVSEIVSVEYEYEEYTEEGGVIVANERRGTSSVNCKSFLEGFLKDKETPFLLWKTAEKKSDLDLGIRLEVMQRGGEQDLAFVYDHYDFTIQDSFFEDFCNGHYQSKDQDIRSTIQAMTDAVTDQNLRKVHAIRTGIKGNDPQLKVMDYGAERRDITTSIKLAYWKKGRKYRMANMKEHDFVEPTWEM